MEPWVTHVLSLHVLPVGLTQQGLQGEASQGSWVQCSHWHETGSLASFSSLVLHDGWLD